MQIETSRVPDCPPDLVSPGWKLELLEDGKAVSRLWVVDRTVRIAGAEVRTGGISSVWTNENRRGKGLASRTMQAALELMEREGYEVSILHGIPDFYHRFGYAVCMPEYEVRIATANAEKAPAGPALRPLQTGDLPALARLYNGQSAGRSGTAVRDPDSWKGFPRSVGFFTRPDVRVAVDAGDRAIGYVVFDDEPGQGAKCRAAEAGGLGGAVMGSLLRFLAERAVDLRKEEVTLALPPDHPLASYARRFGSEVHIHYPRNGEFMGRITAFRPFVEKLAMSLGRDPEGRAPEGEVALATELGSYTLAFKDGKGSVGPGPADTDDAARLGQGALLQLAMGYRSARELQAAGELLATPDQADLLSAWFRPQHPCMYWPDRF